MCISNVCVDVCNYDFEICVIFVVSEVNLFYLCVLMSADCV